MYPAERPSVLDVHPLVKAYYARPGNGVGGSLHLVLDDGNVSDDDVRFCIRAARDRADIHGYQIGVLLLSMSRTQRKKLTRM